MTDAPISFDDAPASTGAVSCTRCHRSLTEYWAVDGAVLCEQCKDEVLAERSAPKGAVARVLKGALFGLGGMLVGAGVWYGVAKVADLQIGLIAILLGWLVGKGVFLGSGKRGGLGYQVMAIAITYFGIGVANVPFALEAYATPDAVAVAGPRDAPADSNATAAPSAAQTERELQELDSAIASGKTMDAEATSPGVALAKALLALIALTFALPVIIIANGGSIITLLIYGIALYEAWKFTRPTEPFVSGPHRVGGSPS